MELELQKLKHQSQTQEPKIPKHNTGDNDNVNDSDTENGNVNGDIETKVDSEPINGQEQGLIPEDKGKKEDNEEKVTEKQ